MMKLVFRTVKQNSIYSGKSRIRNRFFQASGTRNSYSPATDAKTIPKKCQSSRAITAMGKFFWLMRIFRSQSLNLRHLNEKSSD
ncbi:hypothetical protein F3P66_01210 [Agrobacterium fabrum]|uniref:Uncharacterized protein n=1 Tax=Agrobacterium fabrum (strain C58 / ATCC 33970) TaxID=176299 RepID=Q8UC93_AGRFC|nr:hypothetical protein Atu2605 [Agrobacterium fabrum str. C58]QRM58202.1 hypothetical protein F3P66_01210 [Agrobacterium fabrum]TRB27595.1 hypothetical protein EXN51_17250 [Agrobacterium fabrum]